MSRRLVPAAGFGFAKLIASTSPVVSALGPFASGSWIERLTVCTWVEALSAVAGLRLGFAIARSSALTLDNFLASVPLLDTSDFLVPGQFWLRIGAVSLNRLTFEFFPGYLVQGGASYVIVYHDLEDGTQAFQLIVGVRAFRDVGVELSAELPRSIG